MKNISNYSLYFSYRLSYYKYITNDDLGGWYFNNLGNIKVHNMEAITMLKNLQAEITREGVTSEQIASEIHVTVRTLKNKLNGVTEFNRDEMYQLRDIFFPKLGVEYLFYVEPPTPSLAEKPLEFEET